MEQKKKTIIWEENTEPPKNYIWVKSDGKAYEYSLTDQAWVESDEVKMASNETPSEEVIPEESENQQYITFGGKVPKFFWKYVNNDIDKSKEIFESDIIISGDYQSPNASRIIVEFSKLSLNRLARMMDELHLGYVGLGIIYEKEEDFVLKEGDIRQIAISKNSKSFSVTLNYFDSNFVFDSSKVQEVEIDGNLYYEYQG